MAAAYVGQDGACPALTWPSVAAVVRVWATLEPSRPTPALVAPAHARSRARRWRVGRLGGCWHVVALTSATLVRRWWASDRARMVAIRPLWISSSMRWRCALPIPALIHRLRTLARSGDARDPAAEPPTVADTGGLHGGRSSSRSWSCGFHSACCRALTPTLTWQREWWTANGRCARPSAMKAGSSCRASVTALCWYAL